MTTDRPEIIGKLALFLQNKEPLIYLFIVNSDFIYDEEEKFLPKLSPAGVMVKDGRIKFYYNDELVKLSIEEMYFIIIHESYHIFKKHLQRYRDLFQENPYRLNVAEDCVINYEISESFKSSRNNSTKIYPKAPPYGAYLPEEFIEEYKHTNIKDKATTRIVYNWLKDNEKSEIDKNDLIKVGRIIIDKDGNTGMVVRNGIKSADINYSKKEEGSTKTNDSISISKDDIITVQITEKDAADLGIPVDKDFIELKTTDTHLDYDEEASIEQETLVKKLYEQAKEIAQNNSDSSAGNTCGNFFKMIKEIYKSKTDWRKEIHKNLNIFYSNDGSLKTRRPSFMTYPWNPKSRYGILCKHTIEEISNKQKYIIIAIDTSGSIFYDKRENARFFGEIETISKWLDFKKEGQVLSLQWDTEINEGIKKYNKGDWKTFEQKGGGGTSPHCIFDYFTDVFKEKNNRYFINENGVKFTTNNKKDLPFVIVLTDGYFYRDLRKSQLGIYKDSMENILFFTRKSDSIPKDMKSIIYKQ